MFFKSDKYSYCVYSELSIRVPFCRIISGVRNNFIYNEALVSINIIGYQPRPKLESHEKTVVVWNKLRLRLRVKTQELTFTTI